MSDAIVRLRVESQEYDAKLKRAAEGLQHYADQCRKVGGTLEFVEQETLDYVKALGQMESVSRSATGSLTEMKNVYTEVAAQYKKLTDEEKNSPFGVAMAQSLDQLKGRIHESKTQLDDISQSINSNSGLRGALDTIAGKFGLNIEQVTKFGGVVGIATTAIKVARDTFMQSESNIDEWGRTLKGAEGAYDLFLDTLNNGDWSNFFSNLEKAIRGGRDLYNVFDRLKSIKNNNAAAIAIVRQQIQELRVAKQNGQDVDAQLKAATERLAILQKQSVAAGKAAGNQAAFNVIRNGVNSVGGARVNDATINMVVKNLMNGGQDAFDAYRRNRDVLYQRGLVTRTQTINDSQGGTYERQYKVFDINALSKEQQKQYALAQAITEGESRIQEGIAAFASAVTEGAHNATEEFKGNRYRLGGGGGGHTTVGQTDNTLKIVFDPNRASLGAERGVDTMPSVWGMLDDKGLRQMMGIGAQQWDYGKVTPEAQGKGKQPDKKEEKKENKVIDGMSKLTSGVTGIFSGIEQMGLEIPEGMKDMLSAINGLMTVVQSVITILEVIEALNSVQAAKPLAGGGIVPHAAGGYMIGGNSYSGDNIYAGGAWVNSGELVLNRAQQSTLASQLQGQDKQMHVVGEVQGEKIILVANRTFRRKGQGEIVTW